jgi:hypothetical protein
MKLFNIEGGNKVQFLSAVMFAAMLSVNAQGAVYTLLPSDDGYVTPSGSTSDGGYLLVGANGWDGVVKFQLPSVQGTITQALLAVNPYGLPLWGNPVDVYGYGTQSGLLAASDYHAGNDLGSWTLPNLGYGQDAFFDATSLFSTMNAPYVAFNLRSGGVDVFSSRNYNYGHPSELILTTVVPEPSSLSVISIGLLCVVVQRKCLCVLNRLKSQPTRDGRSGSASRFTAFDPAWLSSGRWTLSIVP